MAERKAGVARYEQVDDGYLENRKLRKAAGWKLLWALGVGAVISGALNGCHLGWEAGGFRGLAIATVLMAAMYVCMVFTIAELSAALPHAGGFYSFVRNALGPTGGFICGVTDTIEYVLTPAVIVVAIGGYLQGLVPEIRPIVWWLLFYGVFVAVNVRGAEITLKLGLVITMTAVGVLLLFYVSALATGAFDWNSLFTIAPKEGHTATGLPMGWVGVFASLPFAIWFYLAIEQLPLAAEETHDIVQDMPKALILGILTLLVLSLLTLVLNSGVGGGAAAIAKSNAPLRDGFEAVFGTGEATALLTLVALTGLVASFHTVIYAYGRVLFALSRAGYFPRWISLTNKHHTPYVALVLGAAAGLMCAVAIGLSGDESALGGALLNMAVFGAVISYTMVMISYILLKITRPNLARPYRSPLGIPGAAVGALLSIIALFACFADASYRRGVWGVAIFVAVGIVFFFAYSRHRLVARAPEEEVALVAAAEKELAHQ
jgi:ethanolamine permease